MHSQLVTSADRKPFLDVNGDFPGESPVGARASKDAYQEDEVYLQVAKSKNKDLVLGRLHNLRRPDDHPFVIAKRPHKTKPEILINEAAVMTYLQGDDHFSKIIDLVQVQGALLLLMEPVDGYDLSKIRSKISMPVDFKIEIMRQVAVGLAQLHRQGIVHNDIKLTNIMLDTKGSVKIIDFGIASIADPDGKHLHTGSTPGYAAPEQVLEQADLIDDKTDVYAWGQACLRLLGNLTNDDVASVLELAGKSSEEVHISLNQNNSDLLRHTQEMYRSRQVDRLVRFIELCLSIDPEARPTAQRCVEVLGHIIPSLGNPDLKSLARAQIRPLRQTESTAINLEFETEEHLARPIHRIPRNQFSVHRIGSPSRHTQMGYTTATRTRLARAI